MKKSGRSEAALVYKGSAPGGQNGNSGEEVYLKDYASVTDARVQLGRYFTFYNQEVPLTNVCKESKSSPRLNCVESATCESQQ